MSALRRAAPFACGENRSTRLKRTMRRNAADYNSALSRTRTQNGLNQGSEPRLLCSPAPTSPTPPPPLRPLLQRASRRSRSEVRHFPGNRSGAARAGLITPLSNSTRWQGRVLTVDVRHLSVCMGVSPGELLEERLSRARVLRQHGHDASHCVLAPAQRGARKHSRSASRDAIALSFPHKAPGAIAPFQVLLDRRAHALENVPEGIQVPQRLTNGKRHTGTPLSPRRNPGSTMIVHAEAEVRPE